MNRLFKTTALGAATLALFGCNQSQNTFTEPESPRPIQVVEVTGENTALNKSFSGIVQAKETASLSFRVPGTVDRVLVKKGDHVEKGQIMLRLILTITKFLWKNFKHVCWKRSLRINWQRLS